MSLILVTGKELLQMLTPYYRACLTFMFNFHSVTSLMNDPRYFPLINFNFVSSDVIYNNPVFIFSLCSLVQGHSGRHGPQEVRGQVPEDVQRRERRRQRLQLYSGTTSR